MLVTEKGFCSEIQARIFAIFVDIAAKDARYPFAAGGIFTNHMIGVKTEKFKRFCRVAILVALCVIGAGGVGKDLRKPFLMRLMHFVMVGLFGAMVVSERGNCQSGGGEGE